MGIELQPAADIELAQILPGTKEQMRLKLDRSSYDLFEVLMSSRAT